MVITLKRTWCGFSYTAPNGSDIHISRSDKVRNGEWGKYQIGMGRNSKYFAYLREVKSYLERKYEHGVKPGDTLYMTNNIEVGYVVREVLSNGEFICDEYRAGDDYKFYPTGDTASVFWSDDYWIAPPQSRLS